MGTRSTILLKKGNNEIQFYHHWDSYLSGVGRELYEWGEEIKENQQRQIEDYENDIKGFEEYVAKGEENYKQRIDELKYRIEEYKEYSTKEYFERMLNKMLNNNGYEIETTWDIHFDIEYFYLIDCEKKKIFYTGIDRITRSQTLKNLALEEVNDKNTYNEKTMCKWDKDGTLNANNIISLTKAVLDSREKVDLSEITENYVGVKVKKLNDNVLYFGEGNIEILTNYLEEHKGLIEDRPEDKWIYETILSICKNSSHNAIFELKNFIKLYELISGRFMRIADVKQIFNKYEERSVT